jgi:hypothetical protein
MKHMITIVLAAIVLGIAQAGEPLPLDCVAHGDNWQIATWYYPRVWQDVADEQWQALSVLPGDSVWIGYDAGGWGIPADIQGAWLITQKPRKGGMEVWIWHSEATGDYYLFPFVSMERFADKNGEHYGVHPCGGWRVDGEAFGAVIDGS